MVVLDIEQGLPERGPVIHRHDEQRIVVARAPAWNSCHGQDGTPAPAREARLADARPALLDFLEGSVK
jgi:hypothetical protein